MRTSSRIVLGIALLSFAVLGGAYAQATRLVVRTAAGDSTVTRTAGQTQSLKISALTAGGAVDAAYNGTKTLTFSGASSSANPVTAPTVTNSSGSAIAFGSPTSITFVSGVATVSGSNNGVMTLYAAELANVSVTDGSLSSSGTDRLAATVENAALSKFSWSLTSPQTNATVFTGTNTLTAQDQYGNAVTNFSALSNNVTVTTTLSGTVEGLGVFNNNVLNQAGDFTLGVANLTSQGMKFTGIAGSGTFTATTGIILGTSSSVQITAAPATRLVLRTATGDSVISIQAGTAQNLRITAMDGNGNTDLTYAGTKSLTFSGANVSPGSNAPTVSDKDGIAVNFGTATSITFTNGVATVSGSNNGVMRLYAAQTSATISVSDGSISSSGTNALTATVSAAALSKFAWNLASPQSSGVAFAGTNTLTAQDAYGNTCTSFDASANPVTVTANAPLSGTITGLGSGANNILNQVGDFSSGIASLTSKMIYTGASGSGTFTATATGATNQSSSVTIGAGTATRLVVRTVAGDSVITLAAGVARGLKITAYDASGNIATGYTGAKTLRFFGANVSADSKAPTVSDNTGTERDFSTTVNTPLDFVNGVATASGANGMMRLRKVEAAVVGASDGSITTATADRLTATVTPAGLGRFTVSITSPQVNGTAFTGVNTVTAIDSFGNTKTNFDASANNVTVTTSLSGTVSGLGSGLNNVLNQAIDFSSGVANLTSKIKYTGTVGTGTFTAVSATGKTGTSGSVVVNVGSATRLVITGSASQLAGASQNLIITAKDSSDNVATGYTGDKLVKFSGSGPSPNPAIDPKVTDKDGTQNLFGTWLYIRFTSGVAQVSGSTNGVMSLYRAGKDTIAVTDNTISSGGGDRLIVTVTEDVLAKFTFALATPQQSGVAFTGTNTLTAQDQYGNTVTTFNPATDNVTVSANSPLSGTITGLGSGSNNILNQASDFSSGMANLSAKMVFTGGTGSAPFTAVSASSKSGTSNTVQIVAGGATRLVISGVTSMTAGGTQNLTITAKDASGNTVTSYSGLKTLTFDSSLVGVSPSGSAPTVTNSSGAAIAFGSPVGINFTNGVATVSGSNNGVLRLYKSQTAIVSVSDGTISSSGTDRLTVAVNPAALGRFAWSLASPQINGVAFTGTNTLTAQDDYWNTITSFDASASNVTLTTSLSGTITGLGTGSNNILNRSSDFLSGVANLTTLGMKYTGATGSGTFTATSGGKTTTSSTIQITAGTASRLVLRVTGGDSVVTMLAGDTRSLVITAKDASGNTVTSYTGDKSLTFSGADSSASPATAPTVSNSGGADRAFGVPTTISFSNGVATVTGSSNGVMKLYKAQSATISVTDGTRSSTGSDRLSVTVNPAALANFKWVLATPQINGVAFTGTNTLTARDAYGNVLTAFDASASNVTISTSLTGTVSGLGSGSNNILNRTTDFVSGVADLTAMGMKFTGTIGTGTFTATSAGKAGTSAPVEITPGGATRLVITGTGTQTAGTSQTMTITAKDASGNTVPGYTGVKTLTFSGANVSTSPVTAPTVSNNVGTDVAFGAGTPVLFTNGVATGVLKLYKVETANVAVTDGTIAAAGADRLAVSVSPAALGKFAWTLADPQTNGAAFTGTNTLSAQDDWGNIVPTFDASTDNVTLTTSLTPSATAITGLGTLGNNVLNQAPNFVLGIANLTSLGMKYTGPAGKGVFIATSNVGSKTGRSDSITVNNPAPTITGISPSEANRRQSVLVTVTGTKFVAGSTSLDMGTDMTVDSIVVLSSTQLTARVLPGITATLGLRAVRVSNAGPGGGTDSIPNAFRVKNIPSIANLTPSSGVRGQTYQVSITGTNFTEGVSSVGIQGTGITLNASPVTSPTTIAANITISPSATDGVRYFHVTNADPEGGMSNLMGFTVGSNPVPDITSVTPASGKRGSTVTLTVKGNHFYNGITSASLGQGVFVTGVVVDSVKQMRVTAAITDTATSGLRDVIVTNSSPGGGSDTLKNGFTIENPEPTLTTLSVQNASRLQTVNLTLTGSQFVRNVTTVSAGDNITVSGVVVDSSTSLRVTLAVDSSAVLGPRDILVTNPPPGGGTASIQEALTISNPLPTLATIAPESTKVGGAGFTLTVTGTNFVPGIAVQLGERSLTTTLVNRTRMTAVVLPSDIDTARSLVVSVVAPQPGGGTSNTKILIVQNPAPTLTEISPVSASKLQTLDVTFTGTNFLSGVTVPDFGGADITVNSITVPDSAHLVANITVTSTAAMGPREVFVRNPAPGGGESEKKTFTVADNPKPTITGLDPNSWYRLGAVDVTITGSNFIDGVTSVSFGQGTLTNGMFVINSPTSMTVGVTIDATAATGPRAVSVTNAEPGGGTATLENGFTIVNPVPKLDYVYPAQAQAGQSANVTFYGEGFIDGVSSVSLGSNISISPPTVLSDTVMTANVRIDSAAETGSRNVVVINNGPGGGSFSLPNGFVVGDNPAPTLESISPTTARRLETLDIVFTGSNFVGGLTIVNMGAGIAVNSVLVDSASRLTANVTILGTAATGARTVYVKNDPPGGGVDSLGSAFIVTNPAPTLTSVNPVSAKRGQTLNVVLRGNNFVPETTPSFGTASDITLNSVNVDSVRQMTVNITVGDVAALGSRNVTVSTPAPGGGTSGSVAFSINLAPPPAPTLKSPPNAQPNLPTTLVLKWDSAAGATHYTLQLSTAPGFGTLVLDDSSLTTTSRQVGPLTNNTQYYWRVRAKNAGGISDWSSVWYFTPLYPDFYPLSYSITFPSYTTASQFARTDYRIVGLPGAGTTLVGNYLLPQTQGTDWQVYTDNGAVSDYYVPYDGTSAFIFAAGRAYWMIKKNPWSVSTSVATAPLDTSVSVRILLHSGWNLITNPFLYAVPWSSIQEANAPSAPNPIWAYGGVNGYAQSATLEPYIGYYFYNSANLSYLRIPYGAATGVWRKVDSSEVSGWTVSVAARTEELTDRALAFGVRDDAVDGYDKYDYQKPRAMGTLPGTIFRRPQFDSVFSGFATDFRAPVKTLASWPFELSTPEKEATTLEFEGIGQIPEDLEVYLIDHAHERSVDLRAEGMYKYAPPTPVGQFTVAVGTHSAMEALLETVGPKEFGLDNNFPNPFNPSTTFPVAVPHTAMVDLKIYNILGQEVRTLFAGQLEAGRHWILWDGRNNAGSTVATGVYIARLTADPGISLVKKLMLMK